MGAFEPAKRILFEMAQRGEQTAACFFALGRNFFLMRDALKARDCLLIALRLNPEGPFAGEAEEMLKRIVGQASARPTPGRVEKAMRRGSLALETGCSERAVRWFAYTVQKTGEDAESLAMLSFAQLSAGRPREGLILARRACSHDRRSVYALCAMACALFALGNTNLCEKYLAFAKTRAETPQETALLCQTACEVGAHGMATALLRASQAENPYISSLLHALAAAYWNTGQAQRAMRYWSLLRRLDPGNLVTNLMYERAKAKTDQDNGQAPAPEERCAYSMDLPPEIAVSKLLDVQRALRDGTGALQDRFDKDAGFAAVLAWGLTVHDGDDATCRAMLTILQSLHGERADRILLAQLTDPAQSEEIKRKIIGLLPTRGLFGPHYMESNGRIVQVAGQALLLRTPLTPGCERILQAAADCLAPRYGDVTQELSRMWLCYLQRRDDPGEPLQRSRLWIQALEYAYHTRMLERSGKERHELEWLRKHCTKVPRALRRRVKMLLENPKEEE